MIAMFMCFSTDGKAAFTVYTDNNGLIVQRDGDGGDTAGREGDFWFAQALLNPGIQFPQFRSNLNLLQVSPGVYVRNPVHYNDPKDFSRDQTVPLIIAMGANKEYVELKALMKGQLKRVGRYQNGDLGLPQDAGYYIRAFGFWPLYPALLVGDLFLLLNSVIRCVESPLLKLSLYRKITNKNADDVSDDINHTIALLQAQKYLPTPISWLARKFYVWFRPGGVQAAWDHYFRPETGANPLNELYRPLIKAM